VEPGLDLNILVALDALLQEASVTGAARRLGLSTPAMSHALARIRIRLDDPILARSGRGMVLTPRGEQLKPEVHAIVATARATLTPRAPFSPTALDATFIIRATDYVLTIMGAALDDALYRTAPHANLRFVPNATDDVAALQDGRADLAVGIYGDLPPDLLRRQLLTDRFVCVMRHGHPLEGRKLTLDRFVATPQIQIAPRGLPGGYIDDELAAAGFARRVARALPYFVTALQLAATTDYLLVVSERIARRYAPTLGLNIREVPLDLTPYALNLVWTPRVDADPGNRFIRELMATVAQSVAKERHVNAATRLTPGDPASGQPRKRRR
jgi:DNA-binding transcriptional LysR family regulator